MRRQSNLRTYWLAAFCLGLLILSGTLFAAVTFPSLTGRVVDDAHILSGATIQSLDQKLEGYEAGTGNQVVVVTLPTLQGLTIEDYGYQLGRAWGIGQKGKDNGALLIVAPSEHKVRIEVGYGLEGNLTDAMSSSIIQGIILPDFKAGQMEKGIVDGTDAILSVLGGKPIAVTQTHASHDNSPPIILIIFGLFFFFRMLILFNPRMWLRHPLLTGLFLSAGSGGSSGGSGGGFSGGGGSFGGGGASGGW